MPAVVEDAGPSDLDIASSMVDALRDHHDAAERKRAEERAKFDEMMSRPFGDPDAFGMGGLGLSGSGMGGGGSGTGLGGGGGIGLGSVGTGSMGTGSGAASKPTTTPKPAKPKTPPKKK